MTDKMKGERKTLAQRIAAIDKSLAFHLKAVERCRAKRVALADEKRKRAALLMDEAATIERIVASTPGVE